MQKTQVQKTQKKHSKKHFSKTIKQKEAPGPNKVDEV